MFITDKQIVQILWKINPATQTLRGAGTLCSATAYESICSAFKSDVTHDFRVQTD